MDEQHAKRPSAAVLRRSPGAARTAITATPATPVVIVAIVVIAIAPGPGPAIPPKPTSINPTDLRRWCVHPCAPLRHVAAPHGDA